MIGIKLTMLFVILTFSYYGQQRKELNLYTYIQKAIENDLKNGDSLIVEYTSKKQYIGSSWRAVIQMKGDSSLVSFYTDQIRQDSTLAIENAIANKFMISSSDFSAGLEQEKEYLKNTVIIPAGREKITIQHGNKVKEFNLEKAYGLYYRLRFNESWESFKGE